MQFQDKVEAVLHTLLGVGKARLCVLAASLSRSLLFFFLSLQKPGNAEKVNFIL